MARTKLLFEKVIITKGSNTIDWCLIMYIRLKLTEPESIDQLGILSTCHKTSINRNISKYRA